LLNTRVKWLTDVNVCVEISGCGLTSSVLWQLRRVLFIHASLLSTKHTGLGSFSCKFRYVVKIVRKHECTFSVQWCVCVSWLDVCNDVFMRVYVHMN